jgi:hypothetical protein
MTAHPFDRVFAFGEAVDASEADPDLAVGVESQQACSDGAVVAAPAPGCRLLVLDPGVVAHGETVERGESPVRCSRGRR